MIKIIVAVDSAWGFGKDGKIPWSNKNDMKHFKEQTSNSVCIMGRKTYQDIKNYRKSLDNGILPNRKNILISSTIKNPDGCDAVYVNLNDAIEYSKESYPTRDIFIIGGASLYAEALNLVDEVIITFITGTYDCDKFFDMFNLLRYFEISEVNSENNLKIVKYTRKEMG